MQANQTPSAHSAHYRHCTHCSRHCMSQKNEKRTSATYTYAVLLFSLLVWIYEWMISYWEYCCCCLQVQTLIMPVITRHLCLCWLFPKWEGEEEWENENEPIPSVSQPARLNETENGGDRRKSSKGVTNDRREKSWQCPSEQRSSLCHPQLGLQYLQATCFCPLLSVWTVFDTVYWDRWSLFDCDAEVAIWTEEMKNFKM